MAKNNIRSIRFSNEIAEIIEKQIGDSFNAKFERLVYNSYMLLEERLKQAAEIENRIKSEKERLSRIQNQCASIERYASDINRKSNEFLTSLNIAMSNIDKM